MSKCPTCGYELAPFDVSCPRCPRGRIGPPVDTALSSTTVGRPLAIQESTTSAFSWFSSSLAAGATFFLPAATFAFFTLALSDDTPKTPLEIVLFVMICFFIPLLGGWGGYIASAYGEFWWGAAAGAAFAVLWGSLCRALSPGIDGSIAVALIALLIYEGGAIYGGIQRVQHGLVAIDYDVVLSLVAGILCFALPIPGIVATILLIRSDSKYGRPALLSTVAGLCIWMILLIGAFVSNS